MTTTPDTTERDAFTEALLADPEALADAMLEASDAASMAPEGLAGSELADYIEAFDISARFLADNVKAYVMPVKDANGHASPGTLAALVTSTTTERVQVKTAAAKLANVVHAHEKVGTGRTSTKVYHHRIARLPVTTTEGAVPDLIFYLVDTPITAENRKLGKVAALVLYNVTRTYQITDTETGEILDLADEGQYRAELLWQCAGVVRLLDQTEADDLAYDLSYNEDGEHNVAWSFAALRRLSAIAARRNARTANADEPDDDTPDSTYDEPF